MSLPVAAAKLEHFQEDNAALTRYNKCLISEAAPTAAFH